MDELKSLLEKLTGPDKEQEIYETICNAPKIDALIHPFHTDFNLERISKEFEDILFTDDESIVQEDSYKSLRTAVHQDKHLVKSFVFKHPLDRGDLPKRSIDVIVKKSPNTVSEFGFDSVVDFEILETPHLEDFTYYAEIFKLTQLLNRTTEVSNRDIAIAFKKGEANLFADMEKIHVKFGYKNDAFIPIYIGIGSNQPVGLNYKGAFGKTRFVKHHYDKADSGTEKGFLTHSEFKGKQGNLVSEEYLKTGPVYFDPFSPQFSVINTQGEKVGHKWKLKRQSQESFFSQFTNSEESYDWVFSEVHNALKDYDDFARVVYDPAYMIEELGFARAKRQLDKTFYARRVFPSKLNVAGELYKLQIDERLKPASLVFAQYHKSGELDTLLRNAL